jgi:hypothetical protein
MVAASCAKTTEIKKRKRSKLNFFTGIGLTLFV